MRMGQDNNKKEKEAEWGAWGGEAEEQGWSPIQTSLMGDLFLYTIFIFVLPARRCPCPSPSQRGTLSAGGAQGRRRGAGYLGRRSIDLSGALRFLKPNWEKIFQKRKSFFSWCSWLLCVYLCQFLKRPVWRKISICKINFNSKIQKSKLKRNLWDEIESKIFARKQKRMEWLLCSASYFSVVCVLI